MFCGDVAQLSCSLESSGFINYMEDKASINIHNIDKYRVVKVGVLVFLQGELKLSRGLAMLLAVGVVLSKVINNLFINIIVARAL